MTLSPKERHVKAEVERIPSCDICMTLKPHPPSMIAYADCYIPSHNTWGNVCKRHFSMYNCKLGRGLGQELVLAEDKEPSQDERIRENMKDIDWDSMTIDDFEDIFEDRDPMEFL